MSEHSIDELRRQLKQAEGKVGDLRGQMSAAKRRVGDLQCEIAQRESGLTPGDIVEWKYGRGTRRGVYRGHVMSSYQPSVVVDGIKKNGTIGAQVEVAWHRPVRATGERWPVE